jgi:endonuclease/exonuclease/phosphatase (EEP) superfamily protein YafD
MQRNGRPRQRALPLLLAGAAAAAVGGILASLAHLAWWLELFSHFRAQYAALLVACGAGLLLMRRPGLGVAALALAAANAIPLLHYLGPTGEHGPERGAVKAVLLNLWFRNERHDRVLDYLERTRPDLAVFLEATPAWGDALRQLDGLLPYHAQAGEVFVASRMPLAELRAVPLAESGAMAVVFGFEAPQGMLTVIAAHANWPLGPATAASRNLELARLAELAREATGPAVVLGDFNVTAYSPVFVELLARSGLHDCAAGQGLHATWPALFPPLYLQIDHCLADPDIRILGLRSGPWVGSDHFPLEVELGLPESSGHPRVRASRAPPTSRR